MSRRGASTSLDARFGFVSKARLSAEAIRDTLERAA
jgi:hypothetical protein